MRHAEVVANARFGIRTLLMAENDGGAEASCDFCAAIYVISAEELLELADGT